MLEMFQERLKPGPALSEEGWDFLPDSGDSGEDDMNDLPNVGSFAAPVLKKATESATQDGGRAFLLYMLHSIKGAFLRMGPPSTPLCPPQPVPWYQ